MADNVFDQIHSQAQAQPTPPPGAGNIFDQIHAQAQPKPEPPGFFESYLNSIKGAFTGVYNDLRPHSRAEKLAAVHDAVDNADKYMHGTDAEKAAAKDKMIGALPGGGTFLKVRDGDYAGAAGDVAGLATLGGVTHLALGDSAVASGARGAVEGGAKGAVEPINYGRLKLPVPASLVGGGAGAAAAAQMGIPRTLGAVVGAATPIVRGAVRGAKAALADRAAVIADQAAAAQREAAAAAPPRLPSAPDTSYVRSVPAEPPQTAGLLGPGPKSIVTPAPAAPPDASFVRSVPAQPAVIRPRALIGAAPDVIVPPAPPDASFVRSVPAEYPPVENVAPPTPAAAPAEDMTMLDGIAQSLNGTSFAKASPASQATIRTLASRLDKPVPADLNTTPVAAPRAPMAAPETAAPSKTLQQLIQEDLAAKRAPAPTAATAAPAQAAPSLAEQLRDEMQASGSYAPPAPEAPAVPYNPPGRAANAANLAKVFHQHGISVEDAKTIPLDDPTWKNLSDSLGQKRPSKETVEATLVELRRLEKAAKN